MDEHKNIILSQGGGGRAGNKLIAEEIVSRFGKGPLAGLPDAALLPGGLVCSTDSFVVTPHFFPGGNIGKLAVCGTVNDIYVGGGIPKFLSLAMILEEGFPREELGRILDTVAETAEKCGVTIVTGDTKVVPHGGADGIYLNTCGIGYADERLSLGRERIKSGDAVIVSGSLGDHGMAVMAARHNIAGSGIVSDCASVGDFVKAAAETAGKSVKFMRDPTRGGAGSVLTEIFENSQFGVELSEDDIPCRPAVRAMSEMTGIDPLFTACEGRVAMVIDEAAADEVLRLWRSLPGGEMASRIGTVNDECGKVTIRGSWGGRRLLILPEGDQLPRIC